MFFFSSRRRHTRCALVTGVQTCALPILIVNALAGKPLPVYGDGQQIRDWLYVKDHCSAIRRVLEAGKSGEVYNVGGWNEKPNIDIVNIICTLQIGRASCRERVCPYV